VTMPPVRHRRSRRPIACCRDQAPDTGATVPVWPPATRRNRRQAVRPSRAKRSSSMPASSASSRRAALSRANSRCGEPGSLCPLLPSSAGNRPARFAGSPRSGTLLVRAASTPAV
jgi:hypothetical protein